MSGLTIESLQTLNGGPFSFSVGAGECLALSGPSGCGKTLLLRAIADLDPADGAVLLDGERRESMPAPQWRRQVGWLSAESAWWLATVGEHIAAAGESSVVAEILEKLGFDRKVLGWRVERLSTGEKQRLALFRLLQNRPKVLLLDEPTAALDRRNVHLAEEVIAGYRRSSGASVLWVSHDPEQISRIADRHLRFAAGGLEAAV